MRARVWNYLYLNYRNCVYAHVLNHVNVRACMFVRMCPRFVQLYLNQRDPLRYCHFHVLNQQVRSFNVLISAKLHFITKTCLYNFDPLKPHIYIVKLGFTGYTLFFLFLLKSIDFGYPLEPPRRGSNSRGGSNMYPQSMFWAEIRKISEFFIWKFSFFGGKIFSIFE